MAIESYHIIGVGGIGMSGLAELLVRRGFVVSGSDLAPGPITRRLESLGVRVYQGHRAEHIGAADIVAYSTAVKEDNPELRAAREEGREVIPRGELLARVMAGHVQVAVTGAHGKTSTTAMTAAVLRAGGLDPSVLVGALWENLGSNAVLGGGKYFVAEADESDATFAYLQPDITVITNLDREHLDFYRDLEHIKEVFAQYLNTLPPGGRIIAWGDDPHLGPLLRGLPQEIITYSLHPGADFGADVIMVEGLGCRYRLWQSGEPLGTIHLPLAGEHYVLNSLAACAVGHALGLPFAAWQEGLGGVQQIHRRLQVKGEAGGILVVDDYGHHPTEIATTLTALRQAFPARRLVVAFQPHRYSRTKALLPEFFPVFEAAHLVLVTEIYGAGETVIPGLSGELISSGVRERGHPAVCFAPERPAQEDLLLTHLSPGDVFLTLGAGDIWKLGEALLARLAGEAPPHNHRNAPGEPPCRAHPA